MSQKVANAAEDMFEVPDTSIFLAPEIDNAPAKIVFTMHPDCIEIGLN